MTDTAIAVEQNGPVCIIRFNRPGKKNAITAAMYDVMAEAIESAQDDEHIRVILFLGTDGCFTAGNDIGDFLATSQGGEGLGREVIRFLKALAASEKPMVAGVDGLAIGVGVTMLFHCDMTIASDRAMFKTPFLDLGLVPEAASTLTFPAMMGHARAFELLCLGEPFSAERAREAGFINRVVSPDAVDQEALALAERIAARPPAALRIARGLLKSAPDVLLRRIDEEAGHFKERLTSAEAREAFLAFSEKRPPKF